MIRFVIEQNGVKREIVGDFRICGSRDDFAKLAKTLTDGLPADVTFGWVDVRGPLVGQPNTPPRRWDE